MSNNLKHDNGDVKPVFAIDTRNGSGSATTGVPVMIQGPKLEFFYMDLGADASGQMDLGEAVEAVITCVTQLATTHFFQLDGDKLSIAVYPVAAWTAADLEDAIQALGTINSGAPNAYDLSGATVANRGFKLSAS
jgi:hypothetical protein